MGKMLAKSRPKSCVLISSPAHRALETAHVVAKQLDYPVEKIMLKEQLYEADSGSTFVDILRELEDTYSTALVIGHEPTLSEFIRRLSSAFQHTLPKSGVVGLEFADANWATIGDEQASISYFDFPIGKEDRRRLEKQLVKQIEQDLAESMVAAVSHYNSDAAGKVKKATRTAGKDMANRFIKVAGRRKLLQQYMVQLASQQAPVSGDSGAALKAESPTTGSDAATS